MNSRDGDYAAIVLAGGRSTRFGGVDKTAVEIDGVPIRDRVLAAVSTASQITVVGPEVSGGPVAALAYAVPTVTASTVLTLAGDQPWIAPAVPLLLDAIGEADVAVLVAEGRRHYLAAAWRTHALADAIAALHSPLNAAVRGLFERRAVVEVLDTGGWSRDVDSPADLPDGQPG